MSLHFKYNGRKSSIVQLELSLTEYFEIHIYSIYYYVAINTEWFKIFDKSK